MTQALQIPRRQPLGHARTLSNIRVTLVDLLNSYPEVEQHIELMDLMMPIVRADISVVENWSCPESSVLQQPLAAFGGTHDPLVDLEALYRWRAYTSAAFTAEQILGDHFYLATAQQNLLDRVAGHLRRNLAHESVSDGVGEISFGQAIEVE